MIDILLVGSDFLKNVLKEIRKKLNMTQAEIAKVLNIKQSTVSMIENGNSELTERNKTVLCEKLNVNPYFLENGNGEMFLPELPEDEFTKILAEIDCSDDEFIKSFLKTYWELDDDGKKVIQMFAQGLTQKK